MAGIADSKYVSLTTYKKDGTTKALPVWIADFGDGKVGFTTSSSSFKVKRILVQPGASLSLQMHHHRAEHWVVVDGKATVRVGSIERFSCNCAISPRMRDSTCATVSSMSS